MSDYSAVVFDLGNVLLPFDYTVIIRKLEGIEKGLGNTFMEFYRDNYEIHRRFERGQMTDEQFTDIMLNVLKHKIEREEFCKIYSDIFTVNRGLADVLPVLRTNYKLVLLSNTNTIHQKFGWGHYDFLRNFHLLILSHEVGAVKPEAEIYKALEAKASVRANEIFYTDDIPEYVAGARTLGWDAVQFVGTRELLTEFDVRGIRYSDGR